jgi:hypothetical protein
VGTFRVWFSVTARASMVSSATHLDIPPGRSVCGSRWPTPRRQRWRLGSRQGSSTHDQRHQASPGLVPRLSRLGKCPMVTDKQAMSQVRDHVARTREVLKAFATNGAKIHGVQASPRLQQTALKWAGEELRKAVIVIERTNWRSSTLGVSTSPMPTRHHPGVSGQPRTLARRHASHGMWHR